MDIWFYYKKNRDKFVSGDTKLLWQRKHRYYGNILFRIFVSFWPSLRKSRKLKQLFYFDIGTNNQNVCKINHRFVFGIIILRVPSYLY